VSQPAKFPRTTAAVLAVLAAGTAWFVNRLGLDTTTQRLVTVGLVGLAGVAFPSLLLVDPLSGQRITMDSRLSSVLLAVSAAGLAYVIPGLPVPESADGTIAAIITALAGLVIPSVLPDRKRPVRSDVVEDVVTRRSGETPLS
jgi:hypothetical protein